MVDRVMNMSMPPSGGGRGGRTRHRIGPLGDGAVDGRGARQRRAPLGSDFGLVEQAWSQ